MLLQEKSGVVLVAAEKFAEPREVEVSSFHSIIFFLLTSDVILLERL
jgi:hypothetical protein